MCIKLTHQKFTIDSVNTCKLHYQLILKNYSNNLRFRKLAEHTVLASQTEIRKLLEYLMNRNVQRLSKITNENIFNYIFSLDKCNYSINTKIGKISKIYF